MGTNPQDLTRWGFYFPAERGFRRQDRRRCATHRPRCVCLRLRSSRLPGGLSVAITVQKVKGEGQQVQPHQPAHLGGAFSWKPHPLISAAIPLARTGHVTAPHCKGIWETEYCWRGAVPDGVAAGEEGDEAERRPSVLSMVPVESPSMKAAASCSPPYSVSRKRPQHTVGAQQILSMFCQVGPRGGSRPSDPRVRRSGRAPPSPEWGPGQRGTTRTRRPARTCRRKLPALKSPEHANAEADSKHSYEIGATLLQQVQSKKHTGLPDPSAGVSGGGGRARSFHRPQRAGGETRFLWTTFPEVPRSFLLRSRSSQAD